MRFAVFISLAVQILYIQLLFIILPFFPIAVVLNEFDLNPKKVSMSLSSVAFFCFTRTCFQTVSDIRKYKSSPEIFQMVQSVTESSVSSHEPCQMCVSQRTNAIMSRRGDTDLF